MRRITKATLGGLAGCALIFGATQSAGGAASVVRQTFSGELTDYNTATTDGPFDSAEALVKVTETPDGTYFWIRVKGIDLEAAGDDFGAHLHTGPCLENQPSSALGHYNDTGGEANRETEVWFDLVPDEYGVAVDQTLVSFVPDDPDNDGVMSIVIHAEDAATPGPLSPRLACIPLIVLSWA